jgi:hypothetical protein
MYVYIYIYACIYIYIYIYIRMCIYIHTQTQTQTEIHAHTSVPHCSSLLYMTALYTGSFSNAFMFSSNILGGSDPCVCACVCVYVCMCACICTVCMRVCVCVCKNDDLVTTQHARPWVVRHLVHTSLSRISRLVSARGQSLCGNCIFKNVCIKLVPDSGLWLLVCVCLCVCVCVCVCACVRAEQFTSGAGLSAFLGVFIIISMTFPTRSRSSWL